MTRSVLFYFSLLMLRCALTQEPGGFYFMGKGDRSMFFVMKGQKAGWMYVFEYCHTLNMVPGKLSTSRDVQLVTQFMQYQLPGEALWLPATDHGNEGVYKWLHDFQPVTVGNWSKNPGDRTKNCLILNEHGLFEEESCWRDTHHYGLCETPLMGLAPLTESKELSLKKVDSVFTPKVVKLPDELSEIGTVGGKVFYADLEGNRTKDWMEAFDYCHQHGLRMASPQTEEEFEFLRTISTNQRPIFIGASDMMSMSCLRGNTNFRWLVDGSYVQSYIDVNLNHGHWYKCVYLTSGPLGTDCLSGAMLDIACETEVGNGHDPVCGPSDIFLSHPDCKFYYVCSEEEPILRECPAGLYWHAELSACDFPSNVPECVGGTRPPMSSTENPGGF